MKTNCVNCFSVVAVPARFKIFEALKKSKDEMTVNNLVSILTLKQPTITFHINKLKDMGLVRKRKDGREVYCKAVRKCPRCPLYV